jgi:two-component system, OmpR family, alkaline phosphatase synthesis response regulator PhoP
MTGGASMRGPEGSMPANADESGEKPVIVLVEDDPVITELLEYNLVNNGYAAFSFANGAQLFNGLARIAVPALFILDVMLPGLNGFEICARLRRDPLYENRPVLMLTARGSENDKVAGFESGADDYLTKPFGMRELLVRVKTLIRRFERAGSQNAEQLVQAEPVRLVWRDLALDDMRHRVFKADHEIAVTNMEYELLKFFMTHRGVAYSRDELLDQVWGYDYGGETRTVDVHVRQLRRKLGDDDAPTPLIETVRGRGYRFTDQG